MLVLVLVFDITLVALTRTKLQAYDKGSKVAEAPTSALRLQPARQSAGTLETPECYTLSLISPGA